MRRRAFGLDQESGVSTLSISGTVYDADGSTPVAGATVALGDYNATSAANGTYTISGLPLGSSGSMTCTKNGYLWTAIAIAEMTGNLAGQNFINTWYAGGGSLASCVVAYKPLGAASLAASKVNLVNAGTYDATAGNNPTFAAETGWTFNGTNNYLRTGYTPGNTHTMIIAHRKFVGNGAGLRSICGNLNSGALFGFYGTGTYVNYGDRMAAAASVSPARSLISDGVFAFAPGKCYLNGEAQGDNTQADQTYGEVYIGCIRNGASPDLYGNAQVTAFAIYSAALTQAQIQQVGAQFLPSGTFFMPYGDSKSLCTTEGNWPNQLSRAVGETYVEYPFRIAVAGRTVALAQAAVDASLALKRGTPAAILWDLGVNDATSLPAEATWKANAQYIIDAMHTKWPSAKIYFMRVWSRAQPANCATINGWYGDLVTSNPGVCFAGPDESVWLEGGDDGATMTADGTHYSDAGHAEAVTQWLAVLNA